MITVHSGDRGSGVCCASLLVIFIILAWISIGVVNGIEEHIHCHASSPAYICDQMRQETLFKYFQEE